MHFNYLWRFNTIRSHLLMKCKLLLAVLLILIISEGSKAGSTSSATSKSKKTSNSATNTKSNLSLKSKASPDSESKTSSHDYLLTAKELRRLSAKDRTKYFLLLFHLIARAEIIEGSDKTLELIQTSQLNHPLRSGRTEKYSFLTYLSQSVAFAQGNKTASSLLTLDFDNPFNIKQMVSELEDGTDKLRAEELLQTISGREKLIVNVKANSSSNQKNGNQQWTNTNNKMVDNLEWTQRNEKKELEGILDRLHPDRNKELESEITTHPPPANITMAINDLQDQAKKGKALELRESSKKYGDLIDSLRREQELRGDKKNDQLIIENQKKKNLIDRKLYQTLDLKFDEQKVAEKKDASRLQIPVKQSLVADAWLNHAKRMSEASGSVELTNVSVAPKIANPPSNADVEVTNPEIQKNKIMELKKVDNPCIFGLWKSEFKKMKDSSIKCTRPAESIDSPLCNEDKGKKMFRCNYLGIKVNGEPPSGSCIPLVENNGLNDLTERCVVATDKWVNQLEKVMGGVAMSDAEYNERIQEIKNGLDALETSRADNHKHSIQAYCNDHKNHDLSSLQKTECDSLMGLISELRKLKERVSNATQAQATSSCKSENCQEQGSGQ